MSDNEKAVSRAQRLEMQVSPIFTPEMGKRMADIRMKMLLDQKALGLVFGISQQQISQLERGRLTHPPFTLAQFRAVFGEYTAFILYGSKAETIPRALIAKTYWRSKLRNKGKRGRWPRKDGPNNSGDM